MIHVIATIKVKPGTREKYLAILKANVPKVLAEAVLGQKDPSLIRLPKAEYLERTRTAFTLLDLVL